MLVSNQEMLPRAHVKPAIAQRKLTIARVKMPIAQAMSTIARVNLIIARVNLAIAQAKLGSARVKLVKLQAILLIAQRKLGSAQGLLARLSCQGRVVRRSRTSRLRMIKNPVAAASVSELVPAPRPSRWCWALRFRPPLGVCRWLFWCIGRCFPLRSALSQQRRRR